ncbi:hypothetical protein Val02_52320 [Virgisporangium aliadipatigenens]|uniref:MFS transporter n=1 Tax=Virgisporangium aliadipatigenens TaxID=741659 RepID=A0A8J3YN85_9ACTN|nr:hypothetical protein Val02_52320 [Virgisporangium aliadipatigenens]
MFVFGVHEFVRATTAVTVRQRAVPTHPQGRVGSVSTICIFTGLVVGAPIGGALAGRFDVTAPFWFAFVLTALLTAGSVTTRGGSVPDVLAGHRAATPGGRFLPAAGPSLVPGQPLRRADPCAGPARYRTRTWQRSGPPREQR